MFARLECCFPSRCKHSNNFQKRLPTLSRNLTCLSGQALVALTFANEGQVPIGKFTLDEMANEMRRELTDLREKVFAMQHEIETNKIAMQNHVQSKYDSLINRVARSVYPCTSHSTPQSYGPTQTIGYLDCHDIRCPDGKFLTRFHLVSTEQLVYYDFTCCSR